MLQDRFVLTTELQQYVAGNTQRVAKLIAQQADFEVSLYRTPLREGRRGGGGTYSIFSRASGCGAIGCALDPRGC